MIHTDDKVVVTKLVPEGYKRFIGGVGIVLDVSDDGYALVEIYDPDTDNIEEVPFETDHLVEAAHLVSASDPVNGAGWAAGVSEEYKAAVREMYADNPKALALLDAADGKTEEADDAELELFRLLANAAADAAGVLASDSDTLEEMLDAMREVYHRSRYILTVAKKGG